MFATLAINSKKAAGIQMSIKLMQENFQKHALFSIFRSKIVKKYVFNFIPTNFNNPFIS